MRRLIIKVTLRDVKPHVWRRLEYLYDFGDSWDHQIVVEKVIVAFGRRHG